MRLNEFYDPEKDQEVRRDKEDVRKQKLTLNDLNRLRKYRDKKRLEDADRMKFVSVMYQSGASGDQQLGL
jgi:hypothetical protein